MMHPARLLWPFRLSRFQAILWYWIEPLHNISKCLTTYLVRQWQNTKTLFSQPHEKRISICRIQSCLTDQPCLCLCFGFSQIMRILPFLLITLHFSQIGFTDALTFTVISPFKKVRIKLYHPGKKKTRLILLFKNFLQNAQQIIAITLIYWA